MRSQTIRRVNLGIVRRLALAAAPLPLGAGLAMWWLTAPLESEQHRAIAAVEAVSPARPPSAAAETVRGAAQRPATSVRLAPPLPARRPEWPQQRLTGDPAKHLLLDYLLAAQDRIEQEAGYTSRFIRQERIRGHLSQPVTIRLKIRHEPFSIYMRLLDGPEKGKEVLYQADRHDGHVIGHNGGLARRLLPRVKLPPDSPLVLANNRHPVTQAGIRNLTRRLVGYRRTDLTDPKAETILDVYRDDQGREWPRSIHLHPERHPDRPFAKVIVLYDPETGLPRQFQGFDWWEQGSESRHTPLGESYTYDDVDFGVSFADLDFDPANPDYEFTRF